MIAVDIVLNAALFALGFGCCFSCFFREGKWDVKQGIGALRYFTVLSNLLCAFSALAVALTRAGSFPYAVWLMKYLGTAAVTVTLVVVFVFLGPTMGYAKLLKGRDFMLHLVCPLLGIASFCFFERAYPLPVGVALLGMIPMALYGAMYLYRVVLCPEGKRWEDVYGYNKDGKWPVSIAAMFAGTAVLCLGLMLLYRIGA